jgi:hypothetical protein
MKSQDRSIQTLKMKGSLEPLIEKYGKSEVQRVLDSMR